MPNDLSGEVIAALYMENKKLAAKVEQQITRIAGLNNEVDALRDGHTQAYTQLADRSKRTIQTHLRTIKRLKAQVEWLACMITRYTLDEPSSNIKSWREASRKAVEEQNATT